MVGLYRKESPLGWRVQGRGLGMPARRALRQVGTEGHLVASPFNMAPQPFVPDLKITFLKSLLGPEPQLLSYFLSTVSPTVGLEDSEISGQPWEPWPGIALVPLRLLPWKCESQVLWPEGLSTWP